LSETERDTLVVKGDNTLAKKVALAASSPHLTIDLESPSRNYKMRVIVVLWLLLLLLFSALEGLTGRQKEALVGLQYLTLRRSLAGGTSEEITTLTLEPLGREEANIVLVGVDYPSLSKKQKVEKFLTEGLAAREGLLSNLVDAIMILTRGGVSYNPTDIERVKLEVSRLRREVRLIKLVAAAVKEQHDEL
jgi:hypothetical protein